MVEVKEVMCRFAFRCPDLKEIRQATRNDLRRLHAAYTVLVEHGPKAYAEFKRLYAEQAKWDRAVEQLADSMNRDRHG